jgi:hypothetical protein
MMVAEQRGKWRMGDHFILFDAPAADLRTGAQGGQLFGEGGPHPVAGAAPGGGLSHHLPMPCGGGAPTAKPRMIDAATASQCRATHF